MHKSRRILHVVVDTPLRRLFDYLPPDSCATEQLVPGIRLRVPFGKTAVKTGLLAGISRESKIEQHRLKRASSILDIQPLFDQDHLRFLLWCSDYYHHPVGEVMLGTLPGLLSLGRPADIQQQISWKVTDQGSTAQVELPRNAIRLRALLEFITTVPQGVSEDTIRTHFKNSAETLRKLAGKGWILASCDQVDAANSAHKPMSAMPLNKEQQQAVDEITRARDSYRAFLLNGITGSGKTEVYIDSIRKIIKTGQQALVLVPEIGLTPQFIERFQNRLSTSIGILHSGLADRERMRTWLAARDGRISVIIGTRSAIWTPLKHPGIIIIDEEHDLSYKQQEGFRYSARDLAVVRAQHLNIPVVLGSATPSLESSCNAMHKRYHELRLTKRAGLAALPEIHLLDLRGSRMTGALSAPVVDKIRERLVKKQQVLLFLNRRGYAPVLMCHECGWTAKCPRCDTRMTLHKHAGKLCCHHCLHQENVKKMCMECSSGKILEIGHGTQRLTETLGQNFPEARIARIDRDSTRRKGAMDNMLADVQQGNTDILIGTQMLAKGHHFPGVTLAVIIESDQGLYNSDFRASERMAQIITQVSGRAGRADVQGQVIIQTHHPEHPLLQSLVTHDYTKITTVLLEERQQSGLPPYSYQVLLRAESNQQKSSELFLQEARDHLPKETTGLQVFGPVLAPMEKRAGRYRMQLLLQMQNRKPLRGILQDWIPALEQLKSGRRVRWSLDVDPQDML